MATEPTQTVEVPFDPNQPMPAFGEDAEGVKAKYEWLARMREGRPEKNLYLRTEKFLHLNRSQITRSSW